MNNAVQRSTQAHGQSILRVLSSSSCTTPCWKFAPWKVLSSNKEVMLRVVIRRASKRPSCHHRMMQAKQRARTSNKQRWMERKLGWFKLCFKGWSSLLLKVCWWMDVVWLWVL